MEKHKNIPTLRFPEFRGEWKKKKLGEIADKIMYGMNAAAIPFDGINKYLRITDIDDSSRTFIANPLTSPEGEIEEKYKLKEGDIVFARTGASVGKSYLYNPKEGNLLFAGFLIKFSIINENPYFVFAQTLKSSYDKWVKIMSMRSGQPGINAEEYKEVELIFPTLPEQEKIASFFTVLDKKIAGLKQKRNLLEQYKKGVMQKIFSQELRFKDDNGKDFPEWKRKEVGEVFKIKQRPVPKPNDNYKSIGIRSHFKGTFQRLDSDPLKNEMDTLYQVKENDLIVNITFAWEGAVAIATKDDEGGLVSHRFPTYENDKTKVDIDFFRFLYPTKRFKKELEIISPGGAGRNRVLKKDDFLKIEFNYPTLPEQTKIANFLSAIDDKINHVQTQIKQTEQYKKGLLQQMFC